MPTFKFTLLKKTEAKTSKDIFICIAFGLVGGLIIGYIT